MVTATAPKAPERHGWRRPDLRSPHNRMPNGAEPPVRNPRMRPNPAYDFLLGILTTIGLPLTVYRVLVAAAVIPAPDPLLNAGTSIATALFLPGVVALAWRRSVLASRAERDELLALIGELERRVTETENAVWWGTAPKEPDVERAAEADPTVLPFRHRKSS